MKLLPSQSADEKRRWKIVRTDSCADVPGEIVAADEETGECSIHVDGETKTLNLGLRGLKIVERKR